MTVVRKSVAAAVLSKNLAIPLFVQDLKRQQSFECNIYVEGDIVMAEITLRGFSTLFSILDSNLFQKIICHHKDCF